MPDYSQMTPEQVEALRKGLATPRPPQGQGLPEFNQQAGAALEAMQAVGVGVASAAPNPYANAGAYQAAQAANAPPANVPPPMPAIGAMGGGLAQAAAPATVPNPYPNLPLPQRMAAPIPQGMPFAGNTLASLYGKANETRDFSDIKSIFDRMAEAKGSPVQSPGQPPPMPAVPQQQPEHGYEAPPVWMPAPGWGLDMADPELKRMATNLAMNGHGEAAAHLMGIGKEDQSAMAGHQAAIQGAILGAHAHGYGADVAARGEAAKNALNLMTHKETIASSEKTAGEHNQTLRDIEATRAKTEMDKFKAADTRSDKKEKETNITNAGKMIEAKMRTEKSAGSKDHTEKEINEARTAEEERERARQDKDVKEGGNPPVLNTKLTAPQAANDDLSNSIKGGKLNAVELLRRAKSSLADHGPEYNKALLQRLLNHPLGNDAVMAPFLGQMAGDLARGQNSLQEHNGYKFTYKTNQAPSMTDLGLERRFSTPYGFDVKPDDLPSGLALSLPEWAGGRPDAEAMARFSIAEALLGAMRKPK